MILDWMSRFTRWFVGRTGYSSLLVFFLLLTITISVTMGILLAAPGLKEYALYPISITGLLMGWHLARSQKPSLFIIIAALLIGIGLIFVHLSRLYRPIIDTISLAVQTGLQSWFWQVDWTPVILTGQRVFWDAQASILQIIHWIELIMQGNPQSDPLVNAFIWSILLFLSASWCSWIIRRKQNVLLALLPAATLLAVSLNFVRGHPYPIMITLTASFLLLILVEYTKREASWNARNIDFSEEIRIDLAFTGTFLSLSLIMLAIIIPSINIRSAITIINRFSQEQFERLEPLVKSLGLQPGAGNGSGFIGLTSSGLPRSHLLGSGPELSQQPVMWVKISETGSTSPENGYENGQSHYYWRSTTYDVYDGEGWSTSDTIITNHQTGEALHTAIRPYDRILTQLVQRLTTESDLLYFTGNLLTVDRKFTIAWRESRSDDLPLDIFASRTAGQTYQAQSSVPQVSQDLLNSSGSKYPEWLAERYLELPPSLPARVIQLAKAITEGQATPFAQALAIEAYLRQIPYSLDIPAPPINRDATDYFLFTLQEGYCDYYATAMVVMARAAGLPARMVVGYASGAFDPQTNRYFVTEADAHSWPEIYFPAAGWVEFEPTASLPAIVWPENSTSVMDVGDGYVSPWHVDLATNKVIVLLSRWQWVAVPVLLLIAMVVLFTGFIILDVLRLWSCSSQSAFFQIYHRLRGQAYKLGLPIPLSQTPHELAEDLNHHFKRIGQVSRLESIIIASSPKVNSLISIYEQSAYSPHQPGRIDQQQAIKLWFDLLCRLWLTRLAKKIIADIPG